MKDVVQPNDDAEALAIEALLKDHGIPNQVISFRDTAYDGLFQMQRGWGVIRVPDDHLARATELVSQWRNAPVEFPAVDDGDEAGEGDD